MEPGNYGQVNTWPAFLRDRVTLAFRFPVIFILLASVPYLHRLHKELTESVSEMEQTDRRQDREIASVTTAFNILEATIVPPNALREQMANSDKQFEILRGDIRHINARLDGMLEDLRRSNPATHE
jgi:hypothetical protein